MSRDDSTHDLAERIASSVKDQLDDHGSSRRRFLSRSALAGGTLLALGGGTGFAFAQEDEEGDDGVTAMFDDIEGTDLDVLNYALSLEHLENAFYREGLETFDEEDFMQSRALQDFSEETRGEVFTYVQTVGEHEAAHVDVLTQAVELLGGEPAQECTYNFGIETVSDFLSLGQVFENTGVAAYAGAAPFIESPDLAAAALSIHSVEARHAAILNWLNGESPFPNAFDPASSQEEVLGAVGDFIESCPGDEVTETPTTGNETPTTGNETPTTGNETPTTGNETPTTGNETPTTGNETPTTGNETPTTGNETTEGDY